MTTIVQLPTRLAGAGDPEVLELSWARVLAPRSEPSVAERVPAYLQRTRDLTAANPQNAIAHARLAQAAQATGGEQEAIDAARRAVELGLEQRRPAAVHAAIVVLASLDHAEELTRLLEDERSKCLPPALRLWLAVTVDCDSAVLDMLSDERVVGEERAEWFGMCAWALLKRREFAAAVAAGRSAQAAGQVGFGLYANLGYAHAALGQLGKAIKLTRQALALAPGHRGVALNLAAYLALAGETEGAIAMLVERQRGTHADIPLALAISDLQAFAGHSEDARRTLQRVRASTAWALAGATERAELEANRALLRWRLGKVDVDTTIAALTRELRTCDYASLSIAFMLSELTVRTDHAPLLEEVIKQLQGRHPAIKLAGLRMMLALLRHEASAALDFASQRSDEEPLNPGAAAQATYLIAELGGCFERAADMGIGALSRAPHSSGLVNNTAYALALGGDPAAAKRVLDRLPADSFDDRVELLATRALTELLLGHVERGLAGYRRAREKAIDSGDDLIADLVTLNAVLAARRVHLTVPPAVLDAGFLDRFALAARTHFRAWIASRRLHRELGIDVMRRSVDEHGTRSRPSRHDASHDFLG